MQILRIEIVDILLASIHWNHDRSQTSEEATIHHERTTNTSVAVREGVDVLERDMLPADGEHLVRIGHRSIHLCNEIEGSVRQR